MKLKWYGLLWILVGVFFNPALLSFASDQRPPDIVVVYTGDGQGAILPEGCCSKAGGMARRAARIAKIKQTCDNVIVVDTGDFLWNDPKKGLSSLRAEHVHTAMSQIGYDVVNVADGELDTFDEFNRLFMKDKGMTLTSLNVTPNASIRTLDWPRYVIRDINGIRLAVFGIMGTDLNASINSPAEVQSQIDALRRYLPEIRQKSDIMILLSHSGWDNTNKLIAEFNDIDVAIVGHEESYDVYEPVQIAETLMVKNAPKGVVIGTVNLWVDGSKSVVKKEGRLEVLGSHISCPPECQKLETDFEDSMIRYKEKFQKAAEVK